MPLTPTPDRSGAHPVEQGQRDGRQNDDGLAPLAVGPRRQRVLDELGALDEMARALLVSNATDVRWLTGFTGSAGLVLLTADELVLMTDGRYGERAAEEADRVGAEIRLVVGRPDDQRAAVVDAVATHSRLALQAEHVTWAQQRRWLETLDGVELVATEGVVARPRMVKDAAEVARMRAAAAVADRALAEVVDRLGEGVTEVELARTFEAAVLRLGGDGLAFDTIVASGPNAARPHHEPGPRAVAAGDLVIVDCGATVDGYRSDMTRTFAVGHLDDAGAAMVDAVRGAQAAGVAAVRPGLAGADLDAVCRDHLDGLGLADEYLHGTGHGVGLDIHEGPWATSGSTDVLAEGMVVTVEPGVYRSGIGGVRIEDTVLVTAGGAEALTGAPKQPVVLAPTTTATP